MSVYIREGKLSDATFLAWVMQEAGRSHLESGIWDCALPGPEAERLGYIEQLVRTEDHTFCHYAKFLVAEVDGIPAAALTAYKPDQEVREISIKVLHQILVKAGWTEQQIGKMMQSFAPLQTCEPEVPENAWIIDFVATRKEFRRRGLVSALLAAVLEKGRQQGHKISQVAILIGNTPAQRVYEKAGFKVVDEKRHPDFDAALGCPGIARLVCDL